MTKHTAQLGSAVQRFRALLVAVAVCALAGSAAAERALVVLSSASSAYKKAADACTERLEDAGWEIENAASPEAGVAIANKSEFDTLIAIGARAAHALAQTDHTHLVYCLTPNPDQMGLTTLPTASGVSATPDLESRVSVLREISPDARTIGVLYRKSSERGRAQLKQLREQLPAGWSVIAEDLDECPSAAEGISKLLAKRVDAVWMIPDPAVYDKAVVKALLLNALRAKVPVVGFSIQLAKSGTLVGFGFDPATSGERAAELASSNALNQHETPEPMTAINLLVAEQLGISVPSSVVRAADITFGDD